MGSFRRWLAGLMDTQNGYVEIYKIDYYLQSGIPTLNLILSGQVDALLLNAIFDHYQTLLIAAAAAEYSKVL